MKYVISGIGNTYKKMYSSMKDQEIKSLCDVQYLDFLNDSYKDSTIVIFYDGYMINKYLQDFSKISKYNHIAFFVTPFDIITFGLFTSNMEVCPLCNIKSSQSSLFSMSLYNNLFNREDYKTISSINRKESDNIASIIYSYLENRNFENKLVIMSKGYSYIPSTFDMDGVSGCEYCDNNKYNITDMVNEIGRVSV